MSMLSLLLCFTMLMGATFAWFTDTVTSSNNKIIAGNLDIELYYQSIEKDPDKDEDWTKVTAESNIFEKNALWEPGYTEVVRLKAINEGSLALKYQLGVNVVSEVESINVNNGTLKLSEHIKYGIVDGDADYTRETAIAAVDAKATPLATAYTSDVISLYPEGYTVEGSTETFPKEKIVTLVVYMPTTVDNVANHAKGKDVPTINLGLNVNATQLAAEVDSFDNTYDKDAPVAWSGKTNTDWYLDNPTASEFELSTAEELAGLAAIVNGTAEGVAQDDFSGQTIKLASDIDLGNLSWTTIGKNHDDEGADPFKGTFDGQGNTVYNLNINIEDNKRDSVGFIGYAVNAKIKGLTIENVSINADYFVGAVVGKLATGEIYDCHVKGDIDIVARRNYAAGIVGDGYYSMENCSVVADGTGRIVSKAVAGGLCGRINEGSHSIKNCVVKNMDIQSGQQIAAITGFLHYGNTVTGCLAENTTLTLTATEPMKPAIGLVSGLWYYKEGAPITISGNTFRNITVEATANATGTANILYGWEWSDRLEGIQDSSNVLENISNNLVYSSIS